MFAYISGKTLNSSLVTVLSEEGFVINVYEFYSIKKAKELLKKWYGEDLKWENTPWENAEIKAAQKEYEAIYGTEFSGRTTPER